MGIRHQRESESIILNQRHLYENQITFLKEAKESNEKEILSLRT